MPRAAEPSKKRPRTKGGHFLSPRDKEILDQGPDPYAKLDAQRRSEKKEERRRHQVRYSQVRAQARERAIAALSDLWWLAGTMPDDFSEEVFMAAATKDVSWLERLLHEAALKVAWVPVPASLGGRGEFFALRLITALEAGLAPVDPEGPRPRVRIELHSLNNPLSHEAPAWRREREQEARTSGRTRKNERRRPRS